MEGTVLVQYFYVWLFLNIWLVQEARLSQEQLADQVVKTSEEKHSLVVKLEKAQKVWMDLLAAS